jgi:hypothetical protein
MDTNDDPRVLFPFELFDPLKKRWRRARWKASRKDIEARGGRIVGPGWIPNKVDGRYDGAERN